jgi:alkylation response protein AidB-like acyl-CoA dehydrogenase
MDSPGVTARRIQLISGASPFCEVFFDNVRVPVENVVGEVNAGWGVAKALLGYERSMVGESFGGQLVGAEEALVAQAREVLGAGSGPLPDSALRAAIADYGMQERAYQLTLARIREAATGGKAPGPESSIAKICGSELKQRRWELACRVAGPQALGWEGPGFEPGELDMTRDWLRTRANTIEGGTSEIQLNIIAKRVLGLPS